MFLLYKVKAIYGLVEDVLIVIITTLQVAGAGMKIISTDPVTFVMETADTDLTGTL
jgi:hypothetical protein